MLCLHWNRLSFFMVWTLVSNGIGWAYILLCLVRYKTIEANKSKHKLNVHNDAERQLKQHWNMLRFRREELTAVLFSCSPNVARSHHDESSLHFRNPSGGFLLGTLLSPWNTDQLPLSCPYSTISFTLKCKNGAKIQWSLYSLRILGNTRCRTGGKSWWI